MIVTDWMWKGYFNKFIFPYQESKVQPISYDVTLSNEIIIQRHQGKDYSNVPAKLVGDKLLLDVDRDSQYVAQPALTLDAEFYAGDAILALTEERFFLPNYMYLEYRMTSTAARMGCTHRLATVIQPGFRGKVTLELDFTNKVKLRTGVIGQMYGHLTLPVQKIYNGEYQDQISSLVNTDKGAVWISKKSNHE